MRVTKALKTTINKVMMKHLGVDSVRAKKIDGRLKLEEVDIENLEKAFSEIFREGYKDGLADARKEAKKTTKKRGLFR